MKNLNILDKILLWLVLIPLALTIEGIGIVIIGIKDIKHSLKKQKNNL